MPYHKRRRLQLVPKNDFLPYEVSDYNLNWFGIGAAAFLGSRIGSKVAVAAQDRLKSRTVSNTMRGSKVQHPLATMVGDGFSVSTFSDVRGRTGGNRHMEMPDGTPVRWFDAPLCDPSKSVVGEQGYSMPLKLLDYADLERCFNSVSQLFESDENSETAVASSLAIYINDVYATMCFTNVTNQACWFDIYDLRARHDMKTTATEDFDPIPSWIEGLAQVDPDTGGGEILTSWVGVTPFLSNLFCQRWNVKKVTRVELSPGGVHTHLIHWAPNEFIRRNRWRDINEASGTAAARLNDYLEHLSHTVMVVQGGVPAIITPVEGIEQCTYMPTKLAVCCHKEFVVRWAMENVPYVRGFSEIPVGIAVTEGVNPETGAVEAPAAVGADP